MKVETEVCQCVFWRDQCLIAQHEGTSGDRLEQTKVSIPQHPSPRSISRSHEVLPIVILPCDSSTSTLMIGPISLIVVLTVILRDGSPPGPPIAHLSPWF